MKLLVTGSSGLIGSEVCRYFSRLGYEIHGVDNNQRKKLFGESGDTSKITKKLKDSIQNFNHHSCDIRERDKILALPNPCQGKIFCLQKMGLNVRCCN